MANCINDKADVAIMPPSRPTPSPPLYRDSLTSNQIRSQLHRRAGRHQWQYGPEVQKLEAQLKAQQVHEQTNGQAASILGAAFWELRFPKG